MPLLLLLVLQEDYQRIRGACSRPNAWAAPPCCAHPPPCIPCSTLAPHPARYSTRKRSLRGTHSGGTAPRPHRAARGTSTRQTLSARASGGAARVAVASSSARTATTICVARGAASNSASSAAARWSSLPSTFALPTAALSTATGRAADNTTRTAARRPCHDAMRPCAAVGHGLCRDTSRSEGLHLHCDRGRGPKPASSARTPHCCPTRCPGPPPRRAAASRRVLAHIHRVSVLDDARMRLLILSASSFENVCRDRPRPVSAARIASPSGAQASKE